MAKFQKQGQPKGWLGWLPTTPLYRTRANKGRSLYTKNIFWAILAANNQERLIFENYFSHQFSLVRLT